MFVKLVLAAATSLAAAVLIAPAAHADTLDTKATKRHHHRGTSSEGANLPARGMTMAQVEQRFGAPAEKLAPAGGDTARHPTINRWRYNGYTVYFERNRVIHSVADSNAPPPAS